MRDKLIEMLALKPAAGQSAVSDEQIVSAVKNHHAKSMEATKLEQREAAIQKLVAESCGAFSRETAIEVLNNREREAAAKLSLVQ